MTATPNIAPPTDGKPRKFELTSISKTQAPQGAEGDNWYRYVLSEGQSTITGYRRGSKREVQRAAEEFAERVNERRSGKQGRVHITPARRKQPAKT